MKKQKRKKAKNQQILRAPAPEHDTQSGNMPVDPREAMFAELSGQQPAFPISMEEAPLNVETFIPDYRYRFDGVTAKSGDSFIHDFTAFMRANQYLFMDGNPSRDFADGFACAAAVAALFLDSKELQVS